MERAERALDLDQIRAAIDFSPDTPQREAASENIFLVELVMANERKFTTRTAQTLYVEALDVLLRGRMADIAVARDWELLREVARPAQQDAELALALTDPALFSSWRAAVTKYHFFQRLDTHDAGTCRCCPGSGQQL